MRVQRAQRLIEQQQVRLVYQRPRQGHALALAARQARGPFVLALAQAHLSQHLRGSVALLGRQAQGHVIEHALPRQQARFLEHDACAGR